MTHVLHALEGGSRQRAGSGRSQEEPIQALGSLVGECLNARRPTLCGRVLVRRVLPQGEGEESWLPTLQGSVVREGDPVLLLHAANWTEPIVVGVVDGFAAAPRPTGCPPRLWSSRVTRA